jgi:hypothetical protein
MPMMSGVELQQSVLCPSVSMATEIRLPLPTAHKLEILDVALMRVSCHKTLNVKAVCFSQLQQKREWPNY